MAVGLACACVRRLGPWGMGGPRPVRSAFPQDVLVHSGVLLYMYYALVECTSQCYSVVLVKIHVHF